MSDRVYKMSLETFKACGELWKCRNAVADGSMDIAEVRKKWARGDFGDMDPECAKDLMGG